MTHEALFDWLGRLGLHDWRRRLEAEAGGWLVAHGDFPRWAAALDSLPQLGNIEARFDSAAVTIDADCAEPLQLREALRGLMPWRKGPFRIADVYIDTEWRSDLKWERVAPHLAGLAGRRVIDIGCGNGYHCWRMLTEAPEFVLGVEPSVLFNLQFQALQRYLRRDDIDLLPLGVEDLPADLGCFDTVFSMGVLYHRRSPLDHLYQLRDLLRSGGELCLETLVIEGGSGQVLLPQDRYARMRNVWFIPTAAELLRWLERCGFRDARVVDECNTTVEEQRSTDWMQFESLQQSLDPADPSLTVEGLPAPRRAVFIANRP